MDDWLKLDMMFAIPFTQTHIRALEIPHTEVRTRGGCV